MAINQKVNKQNVKDMKNVYRRENHRHDQKNKKMEAADPVKGDLKAKKDPYHEEHMRKLYVKARLASQNMRNLK